MARSDSLERRSGGPRRRCLRCRASCRALSGFAARVTGTLLLAYLIAFVLQVQSASSAGVCVAIVAQPTAGMAMSKAFYRFAGTVIGGIASLLVVAAFAQDRIMLLAFALWLAACVSVGALLRGPDANPNSSHGLLSRLFF